MIVQETTLTALLPSQTVAQVHLHAKTVMIHDEISIELPAGKPLDAIQNPASETVPIPVDVVGRTLSDTSTRNTTNVPHCIVPLSPVSTLPPTALSSSCE
ncbi:hypothetical protein ABVK25_000179 [Lepraria finkii]|uniref:Uncharacterized protein n=1 Tax=Lepraria finkii TaxID=1340010 RepID=A0ABR4BM60_9LECA